MSAKPSYHIRFWHPSGALEDGAREKFLLPGTLFSCGTLKQWKCTDYDPMWSLCILSRVKCESFSLRAGQTNKLSNFVVRGEYCQVSKFFYGQPYMVSMNSRVNFAEKSCPTLKPGTNFVRGEKFFYGLPYVESIYSRVDCESFSLLAGPTKKLCNFKARDEFCQG